MRRLFDSATPCLLAAACCTLAACSAQPAHASDSAQTAAGSGNTVGCRASDADAYAPGLVKPGSRGNFQFTLVSSTPAPPALNDNRFIVQVSDTQGNALDGDLSVALDMPEHGHMSPTQPEISFEGDLQAFVLQPLRLFMVGLWRFSFDFRAARESGAQADSAVFQFCVE